ncbi:MAG TPA: AmmeMemoRadiSam system protein B [Elusimicrobiota bacterium]|nr:AmmeMemoRadiSam system protein B [Elusimicrobiota bacterium]
MSPQTLVPCLAACLMNSATAARPSSDADGEVRPPAVAGQFYPDRPQDLSTDVESYLTRAKKADLPGPLVALIVPHAGYAYSAPVAAIGYRLLREGDWDTVVLLGVAHRVSVPGAAILSRGRFSTPLGTVPINESLCREIKSASPLVREMPDAHREEHSLEVQLPFLQTRLKQFSIVPILMNTEDPETCQRIGRALGHALKGKKALIVISTDLSHYPAKTVADKMDPTTLAALRWMDPSYFWQTNRTMMQRREKNLSCTYCGEGAVLAGMAAAEVLGADDAALLHYANSGDVPGGAADRVVGYAAVAFVKTGKPMKGFPVTAGQKTLLLKTARAAILHSLDGTKEPPSGLSDDPILNLPAAVFVTLTQQGRLRGCIGTTQPQMPLQEAVFSYAQASAFEDHRFSPVQKGELDSLHIEISILSPLKRIPHAESIVPRTHGVVVRQGGRSGLFLPQVWEQLPDKTDFLSELCSQKAGLSPDAWKDPATELYVFTVDSFEESSK